jgi:hypothetical protein
MAAFTAQLQDPGQLRSRPTGGGESTLGAIGDLLKGGANIAGAVMDKMQASDARDAGLDVSNQLTDMVRENFGATPGGKTPQGPQLVGEQPSDPAAAAAKNSPVVKDTMGQLDRLDQANKQGALSPQELMTRGSVIVQNAINRNPLFAQEIRQSAQAVLGVQPTTDLVQMAEADSNRTKALNAEVTHSQVMSAANAGITFLKPDGTPDVDKMSAAGGKLLFQEKQLDLSLKEAQLNTAAMPAKATHDEVISAEVTPFLKNANPVFETTVEGMMSSVPALVQKYANMGKDKQTAAVLQAVGVQQAQMNNWIDKAIIRNNVSPDAAKQIREYYNAPFESMKGLTQSGDFSSFSTIAAATKTMNDRGQMSFRESMPTVAKIKDAGGDTAVASMFSVFLGTNTDLRMGVNAEANNYLNGAHPATVMANAANAMGGQGYKLTQEQNPDVQSKTLKGLVATMNSYTQKPADLTDTEQGAFGHIANQITALGLTSNDPDNLRSAANLTNTPAALATFDTFAKNGKNANNTPAVAQGIIALNTKNIARNAPLLAQGESMVLGQADQAIVVRARIAFNPVTGKAEPQFTGQSIVDNSPVRLNSSQIAEASQSFGGYFGKVADLNRSFDAVQHLAPHGVGREGDFKALELRQLLAAGSGLQNKPGMKSVPMPAFMQPKPKAAAPTFDPAVQASQRQTESGGLPNQGVGAVSDQGAVGPFQIRPQDFPQYDPEKLKDDYTYAEKANGEIMTGLLKKYHGNHALALAEYHGGPNQSIWGPKTFAYVAKTLGRLDGQ